MVNILCLHCGKSVGQLGAFLPTSEEETDLVCLDCFHATVGHAPMHEATANDALVAQNGAYHHPEVPDRPGGGQVLYDVVIHNVASLQVFKKTIKKNILTLKNLSPGTYTVSYQVGCFKGKKVLARTRKPPGAFLVRG